MQEVSGSIPLTSTTQALFERGEVIKTEQVPFV
jgi:hypothetical protein